MKKVITLSLVLLLLLFVSSLNAQEPDPCLERGGSIDEETGHCVVSSGIVFQMAYPLELQDYTLAMPVVSSYIDVVRQNFLDEFALNGIPSPEPWSLTSNYEVYRFSDEILSIRLDFASYTGGAHSNLFIKTFTFDLATDTLLGDDDIFINFDEATAIIAPVAQAQLTENLGDMADADWIAAGAAAEAGNYLDYVLTPESIIFFFEPYTVAPFAAGVQSVEIPLSDLSAILQPAFALVEN